jgi:hypothetical protein
MRLTRWAGCSVLVAATAVGLNALGSGVAPAGAVSASGIYRCSTTGITLSFPVSVPGKTPKTVAPGAKVVVKDVQATITIPASAVSLLTLGSSQGLTVTGKATTIDIHATDATPATVNAAAQPMSFGPYTLSSSKSLVIRFPATPISVGTWVAGKKGTMTFTVSKVAVDMELLGAPVEATCLPRTVATISSTTVR